MHYLEKKINFHGDDLTAFLEKGTENIFIGVSYICNNLGMTKGQKDRQIYKVQNDETLKGAVKKLSLEIEAQVREQIFIKLDFVHLWLAKINPKNFNERLKDKLLDYQLHVKDILFDAFFGKRELKQEVKRYNIDLNLIEDRAGTLRGIENEKRKLTLKQIYIYTRIEYTAHGMVEKLRREYKKSLESEIIRNGRALTTEEVDAIDTLLIEQIKRN